jgi:2-desacetyl-2-hydroxyethyl bacteriochlorophyllide A dehydrogenase
MRAVVARAGTVGAEEYDDPTPEGGQVLVAPIACGICGTDLHLVHSQAAMPDLFPPIVLGHEFVGEVLDYGPGTERQLAPGSIVTSIPYLDTPNGPELIGLSPTVTGGLAEHMVLQESRLLSVPAGVRPERAAMTEPLAVGAHAVGLADARDGDVALVIGCGPVGLSVIASWKAAGYGPVVASDFSSGRRRLAEQLGADVVIDPAETSPYHSWAELAGSTPPPSPLLEAPPQPSTLVFECVGAPGVLTAVIDSVPAHTRIVVVGVCIEQDTITPAVAVIKELSLRFAFAYRPDEFARALRWIHEETVDVGAFITATRRFEDAADAFVDLRTPEEHCKILLTP